MAQGEGQDGEGGLCCSCVLSVPRRVSPACVDSRPSTVPVWLLTPAWGLDVAAGKCPAAELASLYTHKPGSWPHSGPLHPSTLHTSPLLKTPPAGWALTDGVTQHLPALGSVPGHPRPSAGALLPHLFCDEGQALSQAEQAYDGGRVVVPGRRGWVGLVQSHWAGAGQPQLGQALCQLGQLPSSVGTSDSELEGQLDLQEQSSEGHWPHLSGMMSGTEAPCWLPPPNWPPWAPVAPRNPHCTH